MAAAMYAVGQSGFRVGFHQWPMKQIDKLISFHDYGCMETKIAVARLAALAQENRLAIFRLLVQQGEQGLPAGHIAERLSLASATLSFHLKELSHAGLILGRPEGRFIYYSADYAAMGQLLMFLTDNCCQGTPCETTSDCSVSVNCNLS